MKEVVLELAITYNGKNGISFVGPNIRNASTLRLFPTIIIVFT